MEDEFFNDEGYEDDVPIFPPSSTVPPSVPGANDDVPIPPKNLSVSPSAPAHLPPKLLPVTHNKHGLLFCHVHSIEDEEIVTPNLDDPMYYRYGFAVDLIASDLHSGVLTLSSDAVS